MSPSTANCVIDLTTKSGQEILWLVLQSPRLVAIHLGLPCGTASKARDRPISKELQQLGVPSPAPLYPLGIPGVAGVNATKLAKANELYTLGLEIILFAFKRQVVISVENPFSSYLWAALIQLTMRHSLEAMQIYNKLEMVRFHSYPALLYHSELDISACEHYFLSRQPNKALQAWSVKSLFRVAALKEV